MEIPEYQDAKDLIMMVIKRKAPATILVSKGGLGKSYLAKTLVEEFVPTIMNIGLAILHHSLYINYSMTIVIRR